MGEIEQLRRWERICREQADQAVLPETRAALLVMAGNYREAIASNRFANTVPTQPFWRRRRISAKLLILFGERGGTRTLDPMIKSHVLYRLSYALTHLNIRTSPAACDPDHAPVRAV
jgi:hypothetical protein